MTKGKHVGNTATFSLALRGALLLYIPIGCLTPFGMRFLSARGVETPTADIILLTVFLLPLIAVFMWVMSAKRFWAHALANSAALRFVVRWTLPIFILEVAFALLCSIL